MAKWRRTSGGAWVIELEEGDLPESAYTHRAPVGRAQRTGRDGAVTLRVRQEAVDVLGPHGRLLAASKTWYSNNHPDHDVLFNACLFDAATREEIWFGDLDIDVDEPALQRLAERVGPFYVTPEHPYRFDGLPDEPELDPRVRVFAPEQ